MERRRYKRMHAKIPIRVEGNTPGREVTTVTVDISTGGGSFELPLDELELSTGEAISLEIYMEAEQEYVSATATVRYARRLPPSEDAPPLIRYGVQFREALLLSSSTIL